MEFWGIAVEAGPSQSFAPPHLLRLTHAALGEYNGKVKGTQRTTLSVTINGAKAVMCALTRGVTENAKILVNAEQGDSIVIDTDGPDPVHLCGYFEKYDDFSEDEDEVMADAIEHENERHGGEVCNPCRELSIARALQNVLGSSDCRPAVNPTPGC